MGGGRKRIGNGKEREEEGGRREGIKKPKGRRREDKRENVDKS